MSKIYNATIPSLALQQPVITLDVNGNLMVEGIETWILTLQVPIKNVDISGHFLRVIDPKTGAVFEIRRVE